MRCKGINFLEIQQLFFHKIIIFAQLSIECAIFQLFKMSKNIAILASGSGTNAENIIRYFNDNSQINVRLILSNKADAYVLERAKNLGVDTHVFSRSEFNESSIIADILKQYDIDFIVLAGFLMRIPDYLTQNFSNKIINIHPSLLPKYGGKGMYGEHVHQAVVAAGENESGITIHYINEHYDEGAIIFQAKCVVLPTDTAEDVAKKVHELEYYHYPRIIEDLLK